MCYLKTSVWKLFWKNTDVLFRVTVEALRVIFFINLITDVTPNKWPLNTHLVMRLGLYGPGTFMLLLLPLKKTPAFIDLLIFNASKLSVLKLMTVYTQFHISEAQGYNDRFDIWMKIFCCQWPPWSLEALQLNSSCSSWLRWFDRPQLLLVCGTFCLYTEHHIPVARDQVSTISQFRSIRRNMSI